MSRRKGEFEHRTSIFEGAYRAWSYLGGCDPQKLVAKDAIELLDPINKPHINDPRFKNQDNAKHLDKEPHGTDGNGNSNNNQETTQPQEVNYAYEPLPRSGLAHPFVQGIIAPWLGPKAHEEDVKTGLTTLRTWWQHRRRGESASAIKSLGTERMKGVVQGYTKHFFTLALCMVVNDKEQPPKSLFGKLRLERREDSDGDNQGGRGRGNRNEGDEQGETFHEDGAMLSMSNHRHPLSLPGGPSHQPDASNHSFIMEQEHSNPEMLHMSGNSGGGCCGGGGTSGPGSTGSRSLKRKDSGTLNDMDIDDNLSNYTATSSNNNSRTRNRRRRKNSRRPPSSSNHRQYHEYGDPTRTPVVLVSANGDIQIAMSVKGMTCTQCVRMVETVLQGIDTLQHINGLLDAVADLDLSAVILKIDKAGSAKRIAHEAAKILLFVGYEAVAKEMDMVDKNGKEVDFHDLSAAFDVVGNNDTRDDIDWTLRCTCPDDGNILPDCERHSQMNKRIFEAFDRQERKLRDHVAGCSRKYGLKCSCLPGTCKCKSGCCRTINPQPPQHTSPTDNFNLNPMFLAQSSALTQQFSQMNQVPTQQHLQQQQLQSQTTSTNSLGVFQQQAPQRTQYDSLQQLGSNMGLTQAQQNALIHSGLLPNDSSSAVTANSLYPNFMAGAATGGANSQQQQQQQQQQQLQNILLQQQQQRLSMLNSVGVGVGSGGGLGVGVGVNVSDPNALHNLNQNLNQNLNMNNFSSLNSLNNHSSAASDSFRYDHTNHRNNGYDTR